MTLPLSRIIPVACLLLLLIMGAAFFYYLFWGMSPERRAEFLERGLARALKQEVSIDSAVFAFHEGLEITLNNVSAEGSSSIDFSVESIRAYFNPRRLMLGDFIPHRLVLDEPHLQAQWPVPFAISNRRKISFPEVHIHNGTLLAGTETARIVLESIDGVLSGRILRARADLLGGMVDVDVEQKADGAWHGNFAVRDIALGEIYPSWQGHIALNGYSESGEGDTVFYCEGDLKGLLMPWWDEAMDRVAISFGMHFGLETAKIQDLLLESPAVAIEGEATLSDIGTAGTLARAMLESSLRTSEFDYEAFIDLLPTHLFPDWLSLLLVDQIREGTTTISTMQYRGKLGDFASPISFMEGLRIEGILLGQSFGAGHDEKRVHNISGRAELSGATLAFRDLSGRVGSSSIESLDLVFHEIATDGMVLSLALKVDMDLIDFVDAWSAAMVPSGVYSLLDPFSGAEGGRIKGLVETRTDISLEDSTRVQGRVTLEESTFYWRENRLESVTGLAVKESWDSPLKVAACGVVDGIKVDDVELLIPDIFDAELYDISFALSNVPTPSDYFQFEGETKILFQGTGREDELEGRVTFFSKGLRIGGDLYAPEEGVIEGRGDATILIRPEPDVTLKDVRIHLSAGDVLLNGRIAGGSGRFNLKGRLDLSHIRGEFRDNMIYPVDGVIAGDLTLALGAREAEESILKGSLTGDQARFRYKDETVRVQGTVVAEGESFSTVGLAVNYGDMSGTVAGRLLVSDPWHFSGAVDIDGLIINGNGSDRYPLLDMMDVSADLAIRNIDFRGIPVESFRSAVGIQAGTLTLDELRIAMTSGTIEGSAVMDQAGMKQIDVTVDVREKDVMALFQAISPGEIRMDGSLRLKGWVRGEMDSLDGEFSFEATQGRVRKYAVLSKIFTVTNVYKLMTSERVGFTEEGFAYDSISSTIKITDGVASFDDFLFESPSIQMSAVGKYYTKDRTIDAVVGIQPLETVDRVIGLVPVVNWILLGEDERLIVISARVRGAITEPTVTVAPLDTVSQTVTGILMRTLRLPLDIVISPGRVIPGTR